MWARRVLGVSWPFAYGLVLGFYPVEQSRNRRIIANKRLPEWVFIYCYKGVCKDLGSHTQKVLQQTSAPVPQQKACVVGVVRFVEVTQFWVRKHFPMFPLWPEAAQLLFACDRVAFDDPIGASELFEVKPKRLDRWVSVSDHALSKLRSNLDMVVAQILFTWLLFSCCNFYDIMSVNELIVNYCCVFSYCCVFRCQRRKRSKKKRLVCRDSPRSSASMRWPKAGSTWSKSRPTKRCWYDRLFRPVSRRPNSTCSRHAAGPRFFRLSAWLTKTSTSKGRSSWGPCAMPTPRTVSAR